MRLRCPLCRGVCSAEAWDDDPDIQRFVKLTSALPADMQTVTWEYLAMFRPASSQSLRWRRAANLMQGLTVEIRKNHVQWKRKPARPANPGIWKTALEQITACPPEDLPLTNHTYLRSIVYTHANKIDREAETQRNTSERNGMYRKTLADARSNNAEGQTMYGLQTIAENVLRTMTDEDVKDVFTEIFADTKPDFLGKRILKFRNAPAKHLRVETVTNASLLDAFMRHHTKNGGATNDTETKSLPLETA